MFDQLPVSVNSDIAVNPLELSGATYDNKTGRLGWQHTIEAQQQREFMLQYEVKYPRRENIILE
jgi:hypothetical protein